MGFGVSGMRFLLKRIATSHAVSCRRHTAISGYAEIGGSQILSPYKTISRTSAQLIVKGGRKRRNANQLRAPISTRERPHVLLALRSLKPPTKV